MKRNERENENVVDLAARAMRETPVPDGPPPEVRQAVLQAAPQVADGPGDGKARIRRVIVNRVVRIAAAMVVVAMAVVVIGLATDWLRPSEAPDPGVAFADVQKQILQVRTMTWKMTITMPLLEEEKRTTMRMECAYREPGLMRQVNIIVVGGKEQTSTNTIDFEKGKLLTLIPAHKVAILMDLGKLPEEMSKQQKDYVAELKRLIKGANKTLGTKHINGRKVKGFHVVSHGQEMEIWADFKTGHPVLIEAELPGDMSLNMTDFVFDAKLEDKLFSIAPPKGWRVRRADMNLAKVDEKDLIDGLRFLAVNNNGVFPAGPAMTPAIVKNLERTRGDAVSGGEMTDEEEMEWGLKVGQKFGRMLLFIRVKAGEKWRYAGFGVKLGDKERPICWYRPKDAETYRLVNGDLSVEEVPEKDLPYLPEPTTRPSKEDDQPYGDVPLVPTKVTDPARGGE